MSPHDKSSSPVRRLFSALMLAGALVSAGGCASSRSLGASFDDIGSDAAVKTTLLADRQHDYGDIDVTVFEGRLMLTGTMKSEEGRRKLIENAWKAEGVRQVIDEIYVGDDTGFGQGVADTRIDTSLRARLLVDGDVRSGTVKIAVSNGVVYLLGVARDREMLEAIVQHARTTKGVNKVVSHILYMDDPQQRL